VEQNTASAPETVTITHTGTYGKLTLTGTLTATPAQLQAATAALYKLGMSLKCDKCGSTRHPSYAKPGQSCTHGSGCPVELSQDNGAMCGGELKAGRA